MRKVGIFFLAAATNLGATSGYSTRMALDWKAKRGNGIFLCGQSGDGATNPGIVYANNRP